MSRLSIAKTDAAPWTLKELFRAANLGQQMKSGRIEVAKDGTVTLRNANNKIAYRDQLDTTTDLNKMMKSLGTAIPSAKSKAPFITDRKHVSNLYNSIRASRFENRVNSRWFRDQDFSSELKDKYRMGRRFDLPMVSLPSDRAEVLSLDRKLPGMKQIAKYFDRGDSVMFPVHPQELKLLQPSGKSDAKIDGVRCASSDRTLHAVIPDAPDFLLKVPLNEIVHDDIIRPISIADAQGSMAMAEYMMDWIDGNKVKNDPFCFFPETMAITDKKTDSAAIIRMVTPYPPAPNKEKTWTVCAFSLYAKDADFPGERPLLQRLIENRPDKKVSNLDYFEDKILGPLTKSVFRVALDLGASHVPHGQNLFLEFGEDGQPTGRAPHADLESMWPSPDLSKALKRDDYYSKYGYKFSKSKFEAKNWDTFRVYYLEAMLAPLLQCYIKENPQDATRVLERTEKLIKSEVEARGKLVKKFSGAGQPLRMYDRLAKGEYKLWTIIKDFLDDDAHELIDAAKAVDKAAANPPTMSLWQAKAASKH